MTDLELLEKSIATLNNIRLPAGLTKDVGVPIYNVAVDLQELHDAIKKQVEKNNKENAEDASDEPEVTMQILDEAPPEEGE